MFSNKKVLGCNTSSNTILSEEDIEWIVRNTDKDRGQVEVRMMKIPIGNLFKLSGTVSELPEQAS